MDDSCGRASTGTKTGPLTVSETNDQWQVVSHSRSTPRPTLVAPGQQATRGPVTTAPVRQRSSQPGPSRSWQNHQHSARRREARGAYSSSNAQRDQAASKRPDSRTASFKPPIDSNTAPVARPTAANPGEIAYREHQPHIDTVRIPQELLRESVSVKTVVQESGAYTQALRPGGRDFGLWGDRDAVDKAKAALIAWIRATEGPARKHAIPKVGSLTAMQKSREDKDFQRDVAKFAFRMRPPQDMAFSTIGAFHWPVKEFGPHEVFGPNLERLDPIRMKMKCYVLFIKEGDMFQVMSQTSSTDVQRALGKLQSTYLQLKSRNQATLRQHLLCWSKETKGIPSDVALQAYTTPGLVPDVLTAGVSIPGQQLNTLKAVGAPTHGLELALQLKQSPTAKAKDLIMKTIKSLHYRQGLLKLRIHLGVFVPTRYKRPSKVSRFGMSEFTTLITGGDFRGLVTQELGDPAVENQFLRLLQGTTGSFDPLDMMHERLDQVTPAHSATFDFTNTPAGNLRLEVAWEGQGDYAQIKHSWYSLDDDAHSNKTLLDINLMELTTTRAWHIDLSGPATIPERRVPQNLLMFAKTISLANDGRAGHSVSYGTCVHMTASQTRAAYRYVFARSDVSLDVTRFQNKKYQPLRTFEHRWGITIYRNEWDAKFTENEDLEIGAKTKWADDEETWFPADLTLEASEAASGWEQLMEKMAAIEKLVQRT